ncbi:MAG: Ig-like domain-containing protein [Steroidobacteraceae bacterium]
MLSANASDNVAVASVQFRVDGANLGSALTAAPYTYQLNTATLSNGSHMLSAVATDTSNNSATSTAVTVTVTNSTPPDTTPPTVSITSPIPGATIFGNAVSGSAVALVANASDNVAVASVQFQIDGVAIGQKITASPYSYTWNSTTVANGSHTITAAALDAAGNRTTSVGVTVTVANSSPVMGAAGPLSAAGTSMPASNYFKVGGGSTVVLLARSHTWNDLQDEDNSSGSTTFDFNAYVSFLKSHGMNSTILWHKDLPTYCNWGAGGTWTMDSSTGMPWLRAGPGNASDGKLKFDLSQFNAAYFSRLLARAQQLQQNGIYAIVELFDGLGLVNNRCGGDGYPLTAANNIQGTGDSYTSGNSGTDTMTMTAANAITDVQDKYVEHVIDTLNSLPNVIWEVSEEAPTGSGTWWQGHMIDLIHMYEAAKTYQRHLVLFPSLESPGNDTLLFSSNAEVIAPVARLSPTNNCGTGVPSCKIDINDSDHTYFGMWTDTAQQNRNYLWQNFAHGAHVAFMDPYVIYWTTGSRNLCDNGVPPAQGVCSQPDARWDNFRDNMGYMLVYANTKLDLAKMSAQSGLASTGYCLADNAATGGEFLVYAPNGGIFTVNLSAQQGATLTVEWLDPNSGAITGGGTVSGGSMSSFTPPWGSNHDAVLYLIDSAGHN